MTRPAREPHVWVIEMRDPNTGKWGPTVGVGIGRTQARDSRRDWAHMNPSDAFRIRKYVRTPA